MYKIKVKVNVYTQGQGQFVFKIVEIYLFSYIIIKNHT